MTTSYQGWKKSSRSASQTNCVEVGTAPGLVGVRDTKDHNGAMLNVPRSAWSHFITVIKTGQLDSGTQLM